MESVDTHDIAKEALLNHQDVINTTKANIAALNKALDEQENTLSGLVAEQPDMEELARQNEDMLADVAVGELGITQHYDLCEQMSEADAALLKLNPQIDIARQTIAGLRRKLAEQEATLAGLYEKLPQLIRKFLLAEGDVVAIQYLEKAAALIQEYQRLEGISLLLRELGHLPYPSPKGSLFAIPAYNFPAFDGKRNPPLDPEMVINASRRIFGETLGFARKEADRIRNLGVEFAHYNGAAQ